MRYRPFILLGLAAVAMHQAAGGETNDLQSAESSSPSLRSADTGDHIIFDTIVKGELQKVRGFLDADPELARIRDFQQKTPLHMAALMGHLEIVKLLLERRVEVNAVDMNGQTPLFRATHGGFSEICKLLLEARADPNRKEKSQDWTALHKAAFHANREIVELLLKHGADPHALDADGKSALHWAVIPVYEGDTTGIIQLLLDRKVDINLKGKKGWSPLKLAKARKNPKVIELLEKNGAKEE